MKEEGLVLLAALLSASSSSRAFTLDSSLPLLKVGNPGSLFGYSVAQHYPTLAQGSTPFLLVGAPLDEGLQPGTTRSGAVWKCPVTMLKDDCQQIPIDGVVPGLPGDLRPPRRGENKTGQWLGVTLSSRGGSVLACAHRYIREVETGLGQGICYTLDQGLELNEVWEPCRGRPTLRPLEEWGFCQAGTSGEAGPPRAGWLVLGAPGPLTARGTAFLVDASPDFLTRDKTIYHAPSPQHKYSYLGMSVGSFEGEGGRRVVVGGAPRAMDGRGAVFLLALEQASSPVLAPLARLEGQSHSFSNFGYEIAIADTNGDGRPDLLVGAPEHFEEDKIGGAVFLYLNMGGGGTRWDGPVKLTAGGHESRFGVAIAGCGDLNGDGFDDFAVGAPHDDGGAGVVFLYLGSRDPDRIPFPSQELWGDAYGVRGLGWSLSGGVDLDGNGKPDLAAGSEGAALLFRARPLLPLDLSPLPEEPVRPDGCHLPSAANPCFRLDICVRMNLTSEELVLNYNLKGDTRMPLPRVWFHGTDASSIKEGQIVLKAKEAGTHTASHCSNFTVFIRRSERHVRKPIWFRVSYSLPERGGGEGGGGGLPRLDPQLDPATSIRDFKADFAKDCDQFCLSDLRLAATADLLRVRDNIYMMVMGHDSEIKLKITVENIGMSAYDATLTVKHAKDISFISITSNQRVVSLVNRSVVCDLGDPMRGGEVAEVWLRFSLKSVKRVGEFVGFRLSANTTSLQPAATAPATSDRTTTLLVQSLLHYDPPTLVGSSRPEQISHNGEMEEEVRWLEELGSEVDHVYTVSNPGQNALAKAELSLDWPHAFKEDNPPSPPVQKTLMYIVETPTVIGANGQCSTAIGLVNPFNLPDRRPSNGSDEGDSLLNDSKSRRKRNADKLKGPKRKPIKLKCEKGDFCIHFSCTIESLEPGREVSVIIKARISNKTLVSLSSKHNDISISSRALLSVAVPENTFTDGKPTTFMANAKTNVVLHRKGEKDVEVGIWIWIMSGVLGFFILGICFVGLFFCGFFRRKNISDEIDAISEEMEELTEYSTKK